MTIGNYHGDAVEFVPPGTITIWTQNTGDIPSGWALCDGGNGTPNLLGKFVKGVSGASSSPGSGGGQAAYTLSESQMSSHSHGGSTNSSGSHNHGIRTRTGTSSSSSGYARPVDWPNRSSSTGTNSRNTSHSHSMTMNPTGGSSSIDNIPSYMEVCYIMKL